MNRNLRTALVLVIAVTMAGIAAWGVYRAIQNMPVREVEIARASAVVAARSLPVGSMIAKRDVKTVPWPADNPPAGGFTSEDGVVGRGLVGAIVENEPVTESKLAPRESGAGLPPTIPPGMRAISVKVDEVIGVAGFVVPGTRVDVLVSISEGQNSVARAIVGNVQVLTAGTRYDQDQAKDGKPIPSTVVTLAVTPEDAERVALAASMGRIMLTLRNPLDTQPIETAGAQMNNLLRSPVATPAGEKPVKTRAVKAAPPPPPPPPAASPLFTVETIKAAKRAEEIIK